MEPRGKSRTEPRQMDEAKNCEKMSEFNRRADELLVPIRGETQFRRAPPPPV
jgi:hypothetical protein